MGNLFDNIPADLSEELSEQLVESSYVRIERIVSKGHNSPETGWYDQEENEWVVVLKGDAQLRFEQDDRLVELAAGDYINIPANTRHRVEWTNSEMETVWLAVFYQ
jgi:cupin 2 domain-containing protein